MDINSVGISILIPAFNAEKTIHRCIDSILKQTFVDYEIIIVNDGSIDKTQEIISSLRQKDNRIHSFVQKNCGVSSARNMALSFASGRYVMFIDADDHIEPTYLQKYYEAAVYHEADVVIGGCTLNNLDTGNVEIMIPQTIGDITDSIWQMIACSNSVFGFVWGKLIKRELIGGNNINFNERMYSQEDLNFNLDIYDKAKAIITIENSGYIYEYRHSNRKPDTIGYINNQLKLLCICIEKNVLNKEIQTNIQHRLESYCFGYFMHSEQIEKAFTDLRDIKGFTEVLSEIKVRNEKDYICWLFVHSHVFVIKTHFILRNAIKRMLGRNQQ